MTAAAAPFADHPADCAVVPATSALARCALDVIARPFPHKLDHLILDTADVRPPGDLHPVFDGCFDWHSSVHMHWSLLRLRVLAPALPEAGEIAARFDARLVPALVERELDYVRTPGRGAFERPYGWAWLLKLQGELDAQARAGHADAGRWAAALKPLADELGGRLRRFLETTRYPVRAGTHANSAFAMLLAHDVALAAGDDEFVEAIERTADAWFGGDRAYPAAYEPSGTDFLSPGLCEALLMQRVLGEHFADWWRAFAPADLGPWATPVQVDDRLDGQLVHLDGLNLSRAWCLRGLAFGRDRATLAALDAPLRARLAHAADAHWAAAWPHVTSGDFVATHWLVSFALLR